MVRARAEEGRRLQAVVLDQLATIERLVAAIERSPARAPDAIRQRLKEQVGRLLETGAALDEGRLYQEAALLATRADAEEELKRLDRAHLPPPANCSRRASRPAGASISWRRSSIARPTRCAPKSNDVDTTRAGLELKAVIDQMREQVQNIE